MVKNLLIIWLGGGLGSILRYLSQIIFEKVSNTTFPLATLFVNILGSLIIGFVYGLAEKGEILPPEWRLFLAVGLCGGFTTFSSFAYNNLNLIAESGFFFLFLNIGLSLFLGVFATYFGIILTRLI